MPKYEVRFEIDVVASSPEQAAIAARDILLNPDTSIMANVHEYKYHKPADDWFADCDIGWCADFRYGGVRPDQVFAFEII
jgi:hypothetical protein